ncbi:hypothetical protein BS50DRAFT_187610 [Corynespora cassiicola Philippines]|uniref:Uncharacterized protein n=1 Tax=Corynespora cassiicola Philippines TaxID=1448308 RepID=A0A2T2P713_CORCC|nr:hypothetical protein BS50DRAFT_187610 [Corynespora cassiicola Philippines]
MARRFVLVTTVYLHVAPRCYPRMAPRLVPGRRSRYCISRCRPGEISGVRSASLDPSEVPRLLERGARLEKVRTV